MKSLLALLVGLNMVYANQGVNLEQVQPLKAQDQNLITFIKNDGSVISQQVHFDDKDNGGDGFLNEEGQIILRDFVSGNYYEEYNRFEILELEESFKQLMKDIFRASPTIGASIWHAMEDLTFIFIEDSLPLLPTGHTTLGERSADVQIAIKKDDKIIISLKRFERTKDREYLLLHEVLHNLVVEKDWPAMKHTKVRALTHYIKQNRSNLKEDALKEKFKKYSASFGYGYDYEKRQKEGRLTYKTGYLELDKDRNDFLRGLLLDGPAERMCDLIGLGIDSRLPDEAIGLAHSLNPSFQNCEDYNVETYYQSDEHVFHRSSYDKSHFKKYLKNYPVFSEFITRSDNPFYFSQRLYVDYVGVKLKAGRKVTYKECQENTKTESYTLVKERYDYLNNVKNDYQKFLSRYNPVKKPTIVFYNYIKNVIIKDRINSEIKSLVDLSERLNENRKQCKKRYSTIRFK
jgi:hypothetical protein